MQNVFEYAAAALAETDVAHKLRLTQALADAWLAERLNVEPWTGEPVVGRPERPLLVAPACLHARDARSREGHAALIHAIAHIEFNAINLALDHVVRFQDFPRDYIADWLRVAAEEAHHFALVQAHLRALGFDYGDFPAHDGLWQMTLKTAHDPLARMALVPRLLEARGLDATPPIQRKLQAINDTAGVAILDVILRDEIGHVAVGDRWFRHLCARHGCEAESTYVDLIRRYAAPWPQPPLNEAARLAAGFSSDEIRQLAQPRSTDSPA